MCHRNWQVLAGMQKCFVASSCTNIRQKQKKKAIITVILRISKCQVTIQTGCNYKQRALTQDLVMLYWAAKGWYVNLTSKEGELFTFNKVQITYKS